MGLFDDLIPAADGGVATLPISELGVRPAGISFDDLIPQTKFETPIAPEEEPRFQKWKGSFAPNDSGSDYDLRGAFKAGVVPDATTGHWPDTFKKPNHPTFSAP